MSIAKGNGNQRKPPKLLIELGWFLLIGGSVLLFLMLGSYSKLDPAWSNTVLVDRFSPKQQSLPLNNVVGPVGAYLADILLFLFGFSAYWCVIAGLSAGIRHYKFFDRATGGHDGFFRHPVITVIGFFLTVGSSCALEKLLLSSSSLLPEGPGGVMGDLLLTNLEGGLGYWGMLLAIFFAFVIGVMLLLKITPITFMAANTRNQVNLVPEAIYREKSKKVTSLKSTLKNEPSIIKREAASAKSPVLQQPEPLIKRRLAAVMAADVVSYTTKMEADEFGTGHASLLNIKKFSFDFVKIDSQFIKMIDDGNPMDAALVNSVISMANSLNISCIAEGVESNGQFRELVKMGCSKAQGFLFGKPMNEDELLDLLSSRQP